MITGIGVDVVECERLRRAIERHGDRFLSRVFTDDERAYCMGMHDPVPHFAARFAAKEATRKALSSLPPLAWRDVEIVRDERGPVSLRLSGEAERGAAKLGVCRSHLSLAHERHYAVAQVVLEGDERGGGR